MSLLSLLKVATLHCDLKVFESYQSTMFLLQTGRNSMPDLLASTVLTRETAFMHDSTNDLPDECPAADGIYLLSN